jgi:hypothetical protein
MYKIKSDRDRERARQLLEAYPISDNGDISRFQSQAAELLLEAERPTAATLDPKSLTERSSSALDATARASLARFSSNESARAKRPPIRSAR